MATEPPKVNDDGATPLKRRILTPSDLALILTKHHANRLSFAVLLAFVRDQGRFPGTASEVDDLLVEEIARRARSSDGLLDSPLRPSHDLA